MKKAWALCTLVLLASSTALAVDLSGSWTSQVTFASGAVAANTTFTLHLAGSGWRFTSSWDPALLSVTDHALVLRTSLGPVSVTAGAAFRLTPRGALAHAATGEGLLWLADGFAFRSGYVSFELALGNLTLQLTFYRGSEE